MFHQASYNFKHLWIKGDRIFNHIADDNFIVNILTTGCAKDVHYCLNGKKECLSKDENVLIRVAKGHEITITKNGSTDHCIVVLFPENSLSFVEKEIQDNTALFENGYFTKTDNRLQLLFEQIKACVGKNNLKSIECELLLLKTLLIQFQTLTRDEDQKAVLNNSHHEKIMLARDIIEQDLSQNYTIPELAKLIGTNVQYLKTYFKQYFGQTIMSYSTEKKMVYAKELILTGNHRVADVARMTGYKHSTHFTTAFKRYYGFIPNSLRH